MIKRTPGPWQWVNPNYDSPYNFGEGGEADLRTVERYGKNETKLIDGKYYTSFAFPKFILSDVSIHNVADARLIAAAPDLLEALEDCCYRMERARGILQDQQKGNWGVLDTATARAAIAKAKGE